MSEWVSECLGIIYVQCANDVLSSAASLKTSKSAHPFTGQPIVALPLKTGRQTRKLQIPLFKILDFRSVYPVNCFLSTKMSRGWSLQRYDSATT